MTAGTSRQISDDRKYRSMGMIEAGWSLLLGAFGAVVSVALIAALVLGSLGIGSGLVRLYERVRYPHGYIEIRLGSSTVKVANPRPHR